MELLGDVGHVESHFIPFGDSVLSVQDRCMVCARCTIGLQIILDRLCGSCGISLLSICRQCWCRCKIGAWFALDVP